MAGLGEHPALGFHVPQKLKPNSRVMCWVLHASVIKKYGFNTFPKDCYHAKITVFIGHDPFLR